MSALRPPGTRPSSTFRKLRGRVAGLTSRYGPDDPRTVAARRQLAELSLAQRIREARPGAMRARGDRRGLVTGAERTRLRGSFGQELWINRLAVGMTQARLATAAGLSETTVRRLENGAQRPTCSSILRLARALRPHSSDVVVAELAIKLETAAGQSLRNYARRPLRRRWARAFAEAGRLAQQRREQEAAAVAQARATALGMGLDPDRPAPAEAGLWPGRRPRVRAPR